MATIVGTRSPLFWKAVRGGLPAIVDTSKFSGNVFFVDSNAAGRSDTAGHGTEPDKPFATIDYAIGQCTQNQGDVILVLPGHAETLTTSITCDVAGVRIIGLGEGATRPALTGNAVIDVITITAASVVIENLRFPTPSDAISALVNIAANRATVRKCVFELGANVVDAVTITAAGELPIVEDCEVLVSANGPDSWLKFEGVVDRPLVRRNYVVGSDGTNPFDDGVLDFNAQAITNPMVVGNYFDGADQVVTVIANGGSVVGGLYAYNAYAGSATFADNAPGLGTAAITAAVIANAAIDAATFAADALQAMQDEAEDALEGENLDHLAAVTTAAADMTAEVVDGSILSRILSKTSDTSTYDPTTDALEMASDKLGAFSGDGGAAQDDSVRASLDLAHTDLDAILADTGTDGVVIAAGGITAAKFAAGAIDAAAIAPAAIDAATFAADALQSFQDEAEDALEGENLDHLAAVTTAAADMTAEVVDGSILSRILSKTSDTSTYDPTTDALEMASDKLGAFSGDGGAAQDDSVRASLDLAHTDLDAILADTGTDGVVIAAGGITAAKFGVSAGEYTTDGIVVTRATAALPQSTSGNIFTVTGLCLVKRIVGYVTTVIGVFANATKLKVNSTGAGATTDISGTVDLNAAAVDTRLEITGTFANAMVATVDVPLARVQVTEIVVPPGTIMLDCAGSDGGTGRVRWSVTYVPLEAGAQIVAA